MKRTVGTPAASAIARARSISKPLAKSTSRPLTAPTWKPAAGIESPTTSSPGVFVGAWAPARRPAAPAASGEHDGEHERAARHERPSTVTRVPLGRWSYSHRAS